MRQSNACLVIGTVVAGLLAIGEVGNCEGGAMIRAFLADESAAIISTELGLILTLLGIGLIAGLGSLRDAIATELADVGQAVGNMTQSFSLASVLTHGSATPGSGFADALDFGDAPGALGPN